MHYSLTEDQTDVKWQAFY